MTRIHLITGVIYQRFFTLILGVHTVLVALLSEKADIQYYPEETDPESLVKAVKELGFGADLFPEQDGYQQGKLNITVSSRSWWFWHLVSSHLPAPPTQTSLHQNIFFASNSFTKAKAAMFSDFLNMLRTQNISNDLSASCYS